MRFYDGKTKDSTELDVVFYSALNSPTICLNPESESASLMEEPRVLH